jgi:beta-phosphoglucomutase family hydrolase
MTKPKGLIFDLDGTLTLTQQLHANALREVFLNDYGIVYTPEEDQEKYSGRPSKFTCEQVLRENGKNPTAEEIEKCAARKKEVYVRILADSEIIPVNGAKNFLEKARKEGLKIIVATGNKPEFTKILLQKAGIDDFFDDMIVCQSDVKNQKPAPDIFLFAAEKLGLKPEECIVFEDSINGIQAAAAAHIPCIAITTAATAEELLAAGAMSAVADYTDEKLFQIFK